MRRCLRLLCALYVAAFMTGHAVSNAAEAPAANAGAAADPLVEQSRGLLEKGLSLYELDRQLERLAERERELAESILRTEAELDAQKQKVDRLREQSGNVLRSYYMGERDALLYAIFGSGSLNEAFAMLDFVSMIFESDQRKLDAHTEAYRKLADDRTALLTAQAELTEVKLSYLEQREEQLRLQGELDGGLAGHSAADEILRQIEQLTVDWEAKGLPLFRAYFKQLAVAMQDLPEIVSTNPDHLKRQEGTTFLFQITDQELNRFLQRKDPMFRKLEFEFKEGSISANGREDDVSLRMVGRYVLETEPDNLIRYEVDELWFNGYRLPKGTGQELQEQFPLGFYPKYINDALTATDVSTEDGRLRVELKVDVDKLF